MQKAGVREDQPTTLVGATGIVADFMGYVTDTYMRIQNTAHAESWFFRQQLDQTFPLVAGTDGYSMPSGLQDINWRTVTVYDTPKTNERRLKWVDYYEWRMSMDTRDVEDTFPMYVTIAPDDTIYIFPAPDQAYTFRYDGVLELDELEVDADEPTIPARYQWVLVWGAVMRYAKAHEDGSKLVEAESEYKPIYDTLVNRQVPETRVITGHLYGDRKKYGR
jgi:hypothetical protein